MKKKSETTAHTGYKKGEDRLQIILAASEKLLIEGGYHNFSMRKVASASGISVGNLQHYFPTKENLVAEMLDSIINTYLKTFEDIRHHGTPREQFKKIIEQIIKDLNTKRTTIFFPELWSLVNHEKGMNKYMDRMYDKYRQVLVNVILDINPDLTQAQAKRLGLFISSSIEGHTVFIGYQKPWMRETKNIISLATQSFLWLIDNGEIPE